VRNCPFHLLSANARDLVCGINHAYLTGFLEGTGGGAAHRGAQPAPATLRGTVRQPGACVT